MVNEKLYICRGCGYVFPKELSELIENRVQVYCEMCGTPFSLEGIEFKKPIVRYPKKPSPKYPTHLITDESKSKLNKAIKKLDKFTYLPILIFSGIYIGFLFLIFFDSDNWIKILVSHLSFGICGLLIAIYDINYISTKIENEQYDEILLDAFCFGILGCIIYGVGVLLLIKGILIIIYRIFNPKQKTHKVYNFGVDLKNSLNEFSAIAGIVIAFIVLFRFSINNFDAKFMILGIDFISQRISTLDQWLIFTIIFVILAGFCLIPMIILIIDARRKQKIRNKQKLSFKDAISTFILGIIGTIFFALGIFILLKGILMFFLVAARPSDFPKLEETIEEKKIEFPEIEKVEPIEMVIPQKIEVIPIKEEPEVIEGKPEKFVIEEAKVEEEKAKIPELEEKVEIQEKLGESKPVLKGQESEKTELRLHDSLLPVKDEKDKKVVKEYFSKIFALISKDIRKQIKELKIPKEEKKEILKELAFLTEEEQGKYIGALAELYKELPRKLIERIRKLPNVDPRYYDKIIEQLKYMDAEEQINFIQFLEKNA
ncbi:MAG: hypothetical protein ACFFDX_05725 [Candidatus Odinarchaeota archaeon]